MHRPKPHIAIVTKGGRTWMGGRHYTLNIVKSLIAFRSAHGVDFDLSVLSREDGELAHYESLRDQLRYCAPLEEVLPAWTLSNRIRWKIKRSFYGWVYPRLEEGLNALGITFSYPISAKKTPSADWIPDFQYLHFPDGSQDWEIAERKLEFSLAADRAQKVVLSSAAAESDCHTVFPHSKGKTAVFRFRNIIDERFLEKNPLDIVAKYNLPPSYALVSNQLIPTKNHAFVLEALAKIPREKRGGIHVVFTGDIYDLRNPGFYNRFLSKVHELGVASNISILGLIPKADQVQLLRAARVYITPSLFEGWNTGVEEAHSFGKDILLSDIPVHREQRPPQSHYFDPRNPEDLAEKLRECFSDPSFRSVNPEREAASLKEYEELQYISVREFLQIAGVETR